jgi:hypothetical protein
MDHAVLDSVEREIDDELRARFPGDVIKQQTTGPRAPTANPAACPEAS